MREMGFHRLAALRFIPSARLDGYAMARPRIGPVLGWARIGVIDSLSRPASSLTLSAARRYAFWAEEYFDGLRIEVDDAPRDANGGRTVVIIAELVEGPPRQGDIVYFEAAAALNEARSLGGDVHLYLFDRLPGSPEQALTPLASAKYKLAARRSASKKGAARLK